MANVQSARAFGPRPSTRDGLEFTVEINGTQRHCFISGTALTLLSASVKGSREARFDACALEIAAIASRKADMTPDGEEIVLISGDIEQLG